MYNKYTFDQHNLKLEDTQKTQRICQRKVQKCLNMLQINGNIHQERNLGIELYLAICVDYIEIFLSLILDLQSIIIMISIMSFLSTFRDYG
jgi:multidrug efflux pump subunit AcrB